MIMEWLKQMNAALAYLEAHLEEDLDYSRMAQLAGCSPYHFQRIFSYLAGIPLSEYLRRRRMSKAALVYSRDRRCSMWRAAMGTNRPPPLIRAFQSIHGISPSAARKEGATLRTYPPISFKIMIGGAVEMDYQIIKRDSFTVLGVGMPLHKSLEENFMQVPQFWGRLAAEGTLERLLPYMSSEPMGVLGVSACPEGDDWEYYVAVAQPSTGAEGLHRQIPACTWAVFAGRGPMPTAIQELQKRIITEWLPASGYQYANAPDLEVYLDANPADATFEIWLPIEKPVEK